MCNAALSEKSNLCFWSIHWEGSMCLLNTLYTGNDMRPFSTNYWNSVALFNVCCCDAVSV